MTDDSVQLAVSPPRNLRHVLRVVGWNLLFILAGLLLIGIAGEAYFRFVIPFPHSLVYSRIVPGVGMLHEPNIDSLTTNNIDYWTVQRSNILGFLDREPIDPDRAAESCHITIIGDSFVEAREVDISDKLQVRLEEIAAREAPNLDVTTSAFGFSATGQVEQLAFYDGYARHLIPDLVVLVFYGVNDPYENSEVLRGRLLGNGPQYIPRASAVRDAKYKVFLGADADFPTTQDSAPLRIMRPYWATNLLGRLSGISHFARWIKKKSMKYYEESNRISREQWEATAFALEQFKRRADHDGTALMILTVYDSGGKGYPVFDRLSAIAKSLSIPVVSQHDYIVDRGRRVRDAYWNHDAHWNPAGHQWAAEAIWEHINAEWKGECPTAVPQPEIEVDRVDAGRDFHTPEGVAFVDSFPVFNLEGYESVYSSVVSGSPIARSYWDVHLYDEGLTYVKEPCDAEDVEKPFFLHVFPTDSSRHSNDRSHGFYDASFSFYERGELFNGKCIVSTDLPEYEVDYIGTGQFDDDLQVWKVDYNFTLPEILDAVNELRQSEREPDIRSNFDVYIYNHQLIYAKLPCDADDRDLPFFLHVFPTDDKDLPAGREESGFDNLGFELIYKGGVHDGGCFAAVELPDYDITSIRTGQFVRGEGEVWEASIKFAE